MTYDALIQLLLDSDASDWLYDDTNGVSTLKRDLNVTVRSVKTEERQEFPEPWANLGHEPPLACEFELWCGASFVKRYFFVSVDGNRALLPYPTNQDDLTITREKLAIARAVNVVRGPDQLGYYLDRTHFRVVD